MRTNSKRELNTVLRNASVPILFAICIISIELVETVFGLNFISLANRPRNTSGILGIFTMPLIHSDFGHVFSNASSIAILGTFMYFFYNKVADKTFAIIWIFSGFLVWLFARSSNHLGASGIVYGLASFLFFSGIFRRDIKSIAIALVVTFFYGSIIWGILPIKQGISWEGHLAGLLVGMYCAKIFSDVDKAEKHPYEIEEVDKSKKEYWKDFID